MADDDKDDFSAEEQTALAEMEHDETPADDGPPADEPGDKDPPASEAQPDDEEPLQLRAKDEKPPEGYVPHQAMHAERVKRQELERKLAELDEWKTEIDKARTRSEEPQWVDPLVDPDGFRKWAQHQSEEQAKPVTELRERLAEQTRTQERLGRVQQYEAQFRQTTPDYFEAVDHMKASRVSQLRQMGYEDNQIAAQISADINGIFDAAEMIGMNPAQLAYIRAREFGYKRAAPPPERNDGERLEALDTARRSTQGLGSTGSAQSGRPTASQIVEMSEDEIGNLSEDDLKAAFGG